MFGNIISSIAKFNLLLQDQVKSRALEDLPRRKTKVAKVHPQKEQQAQRALQVQRKEAEVKSMILSLNFDKLKHQCCPRGDLFGKIIIFITKLVNTQLVIK